jgi:hypothetical protein
MKAIVAEKAGTPDVLTLKKMPVLCKNFDHADFTASQ